MTRLYTLLLLVFTFSPAISTAQDDPQDNFTIPKLVAVQDRQYNVNKNLSFLLGYLPDDAFTKAVTVGIGYTYYFTDFTAWEIVNANYAFQLDTGLKKDLEQYLLQVQEDDLRLLDFVEYYATTSLVYTPMYNKNLLFNKSVVYGETSLVIGAGVAKFTEAGILPLISGGLIFKYFISNSSSLKLDVRELVYFDQVKGMDGILDIKIGFDMMIGDTPRESQ